MTGPSYPERQPVGGGEFADPWAQVVERLKAATIGEYDIGYELGRGGMAAVFLAYDLALARHVAIKVMSPALLMGEGMVERFRQEARTIANLTHPGIITIFAVRQLADLHFFVMRFIEGRSLEHILGVSAGTGLPISVVRSLLQQVGGALGYAHRKGVVHRDIKPANILVDVEGTALVTDFGIAKVAASSTHTQTGIVVGTPAYISPEQCMGKPVDGHSDQYSLGVAAYEMLAGKPPFSGQGFAIMLAHASETPRPIRELRPDCPPELEAAVLRMLAKHPADRFDTMGDALDAIGDISTAEDEAARAHLATLAKPDETLHRRLSGPHSPVPATVVRRSSIASLIIPDLDRGSAVSVGETVHLDVSAVDTNGWIVDRKPVWSSSNERVATVSPDGTVTAIAAGEVRIIARLDSLEATLTLNVAEPLSAPMPILYDALPLLDDALPAPMAPIDEPATTSPGRVSSLSATMMSGFRAAAQMAKRLSTSRHVVTEEPGEPLPITAAAMPALKEAAIVGAEPEAVAVPETQPGGFATMLASVNVKRAAPWAAGALAAIVLVTVLLARRGSPARSDTSSAAGAVAAATVDSTASRQAPLAASGGGATTAPVDSARTDSARKTPVRVGPAPVASIKIAGPTSLAVGEFAKLQASIRDTAGKLVTKRPFRWKALTPEFASIDTFGTIQARAPGKASFSATIEGKTDRFQLEVKPSAQQAGQTTADDKRAADAYRAAPTNPVEALKSLITECVQPLQSMDSEQFDQFYAPLNREAGRLVQALAGYSSLEMVVGTVKEPKINDKDRTASLEFSGKMGGGKSSGARWGPTDATIVVDYQKTAQDRWVVKHCRITKLGRM
jgi:serine/threonine-protein kinase